MLVLYKVSTQTSGFCLGKDREATEAFILLQVVLIAQLISAQTKAQPRWRMKSHLNV